jgi:hypothetical protein
MRTHLGISNKGSVRKMPAYVAHLLTNSPSLGCSSRKSTLTAILSLRLSRLKHIDVMGRTAPVPDA